MKIQSEIMEASQMRGRGSRRWERVHYTSVVSGLRLGKGVIERRSFPRSSENWGLARAPGGIRYRNTNLNLLEVSESPIGIPFVVLETLHGEVDIQIRPRNQLNDKVALRFWNRIENALLFRREVGHRWLRVVGCRLRGRRLCSHALRFGGSLDEELTGFPSILTREGTDSPLVR
jgi:hypothetical protein